MGPNSFTLFITENDNVTGLHVHTVISSIITKIMMYEIVAYFSKNCVFEGAQIKIVVICLDIFKS